MINELASHSSINDAEVERLMESAVDTNDLLQGAIATTKEIGTKSKRKPEKRKQRPEIEEIGIA